MGSIDYRSVDGIGIRLLVISHAALAVIHTVDILFTRRVSYSHAGCLIHTASVLFTRRVIHTEGILFARQSGRFLSVTTRSIIDKNITSESIGIYV